MADSSYLIGYDLHEGEDYTDLEDAIKKLGSTWWHALDSTWIIRHPGSATVIRNALKPHLKNPDKAGGDKLLVVKLTGEAAWTGSFKESSKKWLLTNLPA